MPALRSVPIRALTTLLGKQSQGFWVSINHEVLGRVLQPRQPEQSSQAKCTPVKHQRRQPCCCSGAEGQLPKRSCQLPSNHGLGRIKREQIPLVSQKLHTRKMEELYFYCGVKAESLFCPRRAAGRPGCAARAPAAEGARQPPRLRRPAPVPHFPSLVRAGGSPFRSAPGPSAARPG